MADTTYAIIQSGGKQYRAEKGGTLLVERISGDEGEKVTLPAVMYSGDDDVIANGSDLEKVKVEASITEHVRGPKIRVFTYKAKKGSRKRKGHRQDLTRLEVTEVKLLSRKPAAKSGAKSEAKADDKPAGEAAAKKPAAKKPAAKASTAKKPAAKKAPAKKAPAKKSATKKESE